MMRLNDECLKIWSWLRQFKPYLGDYEKYQELEGRNKLSHDQQAIIKRKWDFFPLINPKKANRKYAPTLLQVAIKNRFLPDYASKGVDTHMKILGTEKMSMDDLDYKKIPRENFVTTIKVDITRPIDYLVETIRDDLNIIKKSQPIPSIKPKCTNILERYQVFVKRNRGEGVEEIRKSVFHKKGTSALTSRRKLNRIRHLDLHPQDR